MILIGLLSSSIIFFILIFKDQLLSNASSRSLQATGISIQPFVESQEVFSKNFNFSIVFLPNLIVSPVLPPTIPTSSGSVAIIYLQLNTLFYFPFPLAVLL